MCGVADGTLEGDVGGVVSLKTSLLWNLIVVRSGSDPGMCRKSLFRTGPS